ncbi:MAG: hypothetical protein LV481_14800 [Methylacidiphilales bacterium]|nr:hypothetical protein [Candidatus Methylacidiphilales bacterium]
MTSRVIPLITLAAFLLVGMTRADDVSQLPSREASVVIPLLKAFSPKEGYARIVKILGKEDVDTGNGIKDCTYGLDDGTSVRVRAVGDKVYSIFWQRPGIFGSQVIFAADKTWEH